MDTLTEIQQMSTEPLTKKAMFVAAQVLLLRPIPIATSIILQLEIFRGGHALSHVPTIIQDHSQL
jgi:hypothetical protein